ncbi:MAG TPA: zf-HC2 domain-containing protein [Paenibacillus cookii]|nr:zf-HC2 domain-containing protein [Paenibacillus cookii]
MKCPEVVEWMHRYLDYDLSEEETVQLYEHLKHCPECTETFRMLKSLSRDLEDLPKVTPKFSIVDAIMPQLEAIDQARQEKSASREEEPAEMVPVPARPARKSKFRNSIAGRTAMGAVAAVIILGVAIYNYSPKHLSTAEEPAFKEAGQKTAESATSSADSTTGSGGERQDVEPKQEMLYRSDGGSEPAQEDAGAGDSGMTEMKAQDASPPEEPAKEQPARSEMPADQQNSKDARSAGTETEATAPKDDAAAKKQVPPEDLKPKQNYAQKPAEDAANQDKTAANQDKAAANQDQTAEDQGKATASGNAGGDGGASGASQDSAQGQAVAPDHPDQEKSLADEKITMGISSIKTAAVQINSPDGKYAASVEDRKLVIYALSDQDGQKKAVKTIDLPGNWVTGVWSADSTVFTYQTADDQGTTTSKTYRVDDSKVSNP